MESAKMKHKHTKHANALQRPARRPQARLALGVAWYRAEQWQRFRALAADKDALHDRYVEWEAAATEKVRELRARGIDVQPVLIDVEELAQWCQDRKMAIDGAARSQFVAEKVQKASEGRQ
jgi:hypothetical protein